MRSLLRKSPMFAKVRSMSETNDTKTRRSHLADVFEHMLARWWGMGAAYLIVFALPLLPLILGRRMFADSDSLGLNLPFQLSLFTMKGLSNGSFWWNPYNFHGFPSFIGESASTEPLPYLLSAILPPLAAYNMTLLVHMAVGATIFAMLLKRYGVSSIAALLGGFTFVASNWWSVPWISSSALVMMTPLTLLSLSIGKKNPKTSFGLTVVMLTYAWYSVHLIHIPILWIVCGLFALALSVQSKPYYLGVFIRSPLASYLVAFCASTILALPKILPALLYASLSFRAGGVPFEQASLGGITPIIITHAILPFFSLPQAMNGEGAPIYVGIFGMACACAALTRSTREVRLLATLYVLFFLVALNHSPLFWLIHKIPPFSFIRGEGRWLPAGNVALAALAAIGFDQLMTNQAEAWRMRIRRFAIWLLGIFLGLSAVVISILTIWRGPLTALLFRIFENRYYEHTSGLPLAHYHAVLSGYLDETIATFNPMTAKTGFAVLALATLAFLFSDSLWKKLGAHRNIVTLLAAIMTTLPLLWLRHQTVTSNDFPLPSLTTVYARAHGPIFSVFPNLAKYLLLDPQHPTAAEGARFQSAMFVPNHNVWYGVESINYFDNLMSRRMGRLLAWVGSESIRGTTKDNLSTEPITPEKKIATMLERKDVLDILNARTILSNWPLHDPQLNLVSDAMPPLPREVPLYVYDNLTARPFAYFATSVRMIKPNEDAAFTLLTNELWPHFSSLIECEHCVNDDVRGEGTVMVMRRDPTAIEVKTTSTRKQWLVISTNNLPGWSVTIDGIPVTPSVANVAFFGVPVTAGEHKVSLRFSFPKLFVASVERITKKLVR